MLRAAGTLVIFRYHIFVIIVLINICAVGDSFTYISGWYMQWNNRKTFWNFWIRWCNYTSVMQLLEIAQVADEHVSPKPFLCCGYVFSPSLHWDWIMEFALQVEIHHLGVYLRHWFHSHLDYPENHLTTRSLFLVWNAGQWVQVNNQVQDLQYKQHVWSWNFPSAFHHVCILIRSMEVGFQFQSAYFLCFLSLGYHFSSQ
jgi:hypothetical protein